jgi:hypothetical protein
VTHAPFFLGIFPLFSPPKRQCRLLMRLMITLFSLFSLQLHICKDTKHQDPARAASPQTPHISPDPDPGSRRAAR